MVDEFQSIPGANYALMLSELAKYGVQLVLGTQSLGVLNEASRETRLSWLANVSTLFVFRCGAEDAEVLAGELSIGARDGHTIEAADINGLPDHACFVRTRAKNGAPTVFRSKHAKPTLAIRRCGRASSIASREKHGVDAQVVDRWLACAYQFHALDPRDSVAAAPPARGLASRAACRRSLQSRTQRRTQPCVIVIRCRL